MTFFNKYLKRPLSLLLALMMLFCICACGSASDTDKDADKAKDPTKDEALSDNMGTVDVAPENVIVPTNVKYRVGVILCSNDQEGFDAYYGFIETFRDHDTENNGTHHEIHIANYESVEKCKEVVEEYIAGDVHLIFAVGKNAVLGASQATTDIPIIFCNIDDPKELGLMTSTVNPDKNITGVSDLTPSQNQVEFIKELLPGAKKISALHYATDANSILVSTLAQATAESLGLSYSSYSANNKSQLAATLDKALSDTDVLYVCEDELTLANMDAIMEAANKKNVPVISTGTKFMAKGALATTQPDYYKLGYSAGELALICLMEIKPLSEIAVEYPVDCINYVNREIAEKYSVTPPENNFKYFGEEEQ